MVWQFLAWTAGTSFFVFFCYLLRPLEYFPITFFTIIAAIFVIIDPREWMLQSYFEAHEFLLTMPFNGFVEQYFHTVVTIVSALWLAHRTLQTLLKPVSDLINILGVDIPDPPDVCLDNIRSDAATLSWSRPPSHKPVQKYSIQVNGVHVGDSTGNEVAITVTGLKPNHFYNIAVIAIAPSNFQSAGPVIRLRTFGKDGKPQLSSTRLPAHSAPNQHRRVPSTNDENDKKPDLILCPVPSLEAATSTDGSISVVRDSNGSLTAQRRNTVNRRQSPSVSSDRPQLRNQDSEEIELSLDELNKRFEIIRKEIEDTSTHFAKDEADSKFQEDELKKDKEKKRSQLKDKEEQTAQLKALVRTTMEQMRAAEKERFKKEQSLNDKENKKVKIRENITKLEQEADRLTKEREGFPSQKSDLLQRQDKQVQSLDESTKELQEKCVELESELKEKAKQLQDLKVTRESFPVSDDKHWKEEDIRIEKEWEFKISESRSGLTLELSTAQYLEQQIQSLTEQISTLHQQHRLFYQQHGSNQLDYNSSIPDQQKRLSSNGIVLREQSSPSPHPLPQSEANYGQPSSFVHPPFPPRLFPHDPDTTDGPSTEAEFKIASGKLSPLAQTLLPSNIFDEMEDQHGERMNRSHMRSSVGVTEDGTQSPASPSPSYPTFSSPHGSNPNLPYSVYAEGADRISLNHSQAPNSPAANSHRLSNLLSTFQRGRGAKPIDETGPPIGSLKSGQSRSFPRGTEDNEHHDSRRRLHLPWINRSSTGPEAASGGHSSLGAKRLNSFKTPNVVDGDINLSRPPSIASSDMPRPSTDSGSIWGQPNESVVPMNRPWQATDGWQSCNTSRRPSVHRTGGIPLTTSLASADDEILNEYDLRNPQTSASQVGVIGSGHPAPTKIVNHGLNPNAPTFMGNLFKRDKSKSREVVPSVGHALSRDDTLSESGMSRDTQSTHTQTSISVTESHESLVLEASLSNAPLELNTLSGSLSKNSNIKKLLRKGSSSKFSLSSRLGKDSGLFKKGPGNTATLDRNSSGDQRSSVGDADDISEDVQLGRSYESVANSPSMGLKASKDGSQSRRGSWRFSKKKLGKDTLPKTSLEVDRSASDG